MRLLYTTIFFCLFTGLSAQLFEASKAEHGGSPATARPAIELAVQSPDGDFVAVVVRDDQAANTQNIVLYRIEASDATVIDSSDVAAAGVQFPLDVIRTADGHYWVLGIETVFGEDNATDILLLEFSAELDPLTSYRLDRDRYDQAFKLVESAAGALTLLVGSRFTVNDALSYELLTVSSEDGSNISAVDLPPFDLTGSSLSLTAGAAHKVMVLSAATQAIGFATFDTQNGTMESSLLQFLPTPCSEVPQGPDSRNAVYDAERQLYISVDRCLNVFEIEQGGNYSVVNTDNGSFPFFPVGGDVFLQFSQDSLEVFEGNNRYRIGQGQTDYVLGSALTLNFFVFSEWQNATATNKNILFRKGREPFTARLVDLNTLAFTQVEGLDHLTNQFFSYINRAVGFNDGEVVVAEDVSGGANILFYNSEAELLDSLLIRPGREADVQGFSVGADGNYRAVIFTTGGADDRIDVIRFNRQLGIIDTVYTEEVAFLSSGFSGSAVGVNGNLYFSYQTRNDIFDVIKNIVGVQPDGTEIFRAAYEETEVYRPDFERFDVDLAGNLYLAFNSAQGDSLLILQYNSDGNLVKELTFAQADRLLRNTWDVTVNNDGSRLFVGASDFTGVNRYPVFQEIDLVNDSILRIVELTDGASAASSMHATYQEISNSLLLVYPRYDATANINEQYQTVFQAYGPAGDQDLFFEEVIASNRNPFLPYDMVSTSVIEAYVCGVQSDDTNTQRSALLTLRFDPISSVEEVADLVTTTNLQVFPNPTTDLARVNWDNTLVGNAYELQLLTNDGRLLRRWLGELPVGRASLDLDMSQLPSGAYLLRLASDSGVVTERVVKQ